MNRYYIIHKPFRVMSQFSPVEGKKTLKDFFEVPTDVYPVGRLDYDSEGLLILTNDTRLNALLLSPENAHQREYWVQVEGEITEEAMRLMEKGVIISAKGKQFRTKKCTARRFPVPPEVPERTPPIRVRKSVADSWISLTLTEGKNRQVRKMTAHVGYPTLRLIRYSMEYLTLQNLKPGEMNQCSKAELYNLLKIQKSDI